MGRLTILPVHSKRQRETVGGATEQLSHSDMINLADILTGWAKSRGVSREWSARLIGWAETMQGLADKVGPTWSPPEPRSLSLIGLSPGDYENGEAKV